MNKINKEELEGLTLDELLERYSLEELEKLLPFKKLLEKFPDAKEDPEGEPGVLLGDEIERYIKDFKLIVPFDRENLKAASYRLTVGDEYALGGNDGRLYDKEKDEITIPPFEVAIIKTREIINMPRFLVGRWNILVSRAYQGLLWVGGPQVDPGWVGHLYCPIYNLSNEAVKLKMDDPLARIDFIRTTTFKKESEKFQFPRLPKRINFDDYNWKLKSALFTEAGGRIDKIEATLKQFKERSRQFKERAEKEIEKFSSKLDTYIGIVFTIVAIIIAALSILVSSSQTSQTSLSFPIWLGVGVTLSIIALVISIIALSSRVKLEINDNWFKIVVITYIIVSAIAMTILVIKVL